MSGVWKVAESAYLTGRRLMGPAFFPVRASARLGVRLLSRARRFELPVDDPYNYRYLTGLHEPGTVRVVKKTLRRGMVAVDVGAHVGYFTRLFAVIVGPEGRVCAFEPHPASFEVLEHNTGGFSNVSLFNHAISDRKMRVSLYESRSSRGHSLYAASTLGGFVGVNEVQTVPLGEVLRGQKINLVKIDVEGGEIEVLKGMRALVTPLWAPALIVECNPFALAARGSSERVLFDAILRMGYRLWGIDEEARRLIPLPDRDRLIEILRVGPKYVNLYCAKR